MADLHVFIEDVLVRLARVQRLRPQATNNVWFVEEVRRLELVTLNLIREIAGTDPRVALKLRELIGSLHGDTQSGTEAPACSGRDCNCESYSRQS